MDDSVSTLTSSIALASEVQSEQGTVEQPTSSNESTTFATLPAVEAATVEMDMSIVESKANKRGKVLLAPGRSPMHWHKFNVDSKPIYPYYYQLYRKSTIAIGQQLPSSVSSNNDLDPGSSVSHQKHFAEQTRSSSSHQSYPALVGGRNVPPLSSLACIPIEDVAKHNKKDDAWICIKNVIYFVSPYLSYHPGGERVLSQFFGKDASIAFDQFHKYIDASAILSNFIVGYLKAPESVSNLYVSNIHPFKQS
jgi:cytochrome b involved in lipid metabolism